MKGTLIKVETALTLSQLFKENVLPRFVKFQLVTIRHVHFASVFSNVEIAQFASMACSSL